MCSYSSYRENHYTLCGVEDASNLCGLEDEHRCLFHNGICWRKKIKIAKSKTNGHGHAGIFENGSG